MYETTGTVVYQYTRGHGYLGCFSAQERRQPGAVRPTHATPMVARVRGYFSKSRRAITYFLRVHALLRPIARGIGRFAGAAVVRSRTGRR